MTRHRRLAATVGAFGLGATALAGATAAPASAAPPAAGIHWQQCPQYSDAAIEATGVPADQVAAFRALWARTECGTVSVPLDYRKPGGRHLTVAVTRLKATDQAHRLGSLAVNPGGPGGSGYLVPISLILRGNAALNQRYDLIGFDPRGIGYSTKVNCPPPDRGGPPAPGPLTEAAAKKLYDDTVRANQACLATDPEFLRQLTTANVARDLNQVRQALRERTLSYFGASWGTLLGAVYRSMFPATVGRMWLDSVVGPDANRLDVRNADTTAASEQAVARMAAWIAERDATYHLGDTQQRVQAAIVAMRQALDANPVQFSDVPQPLDGNFIAFLATAPSPLWADASAALAAMKDAKSGDPAPPAVKPIVTPPPDQPGPPPADTPEEMNPTANQAMLCNDDTSAHDFDTFWSDYQRLARQYPVTAGLGLPTQPCAGWPVPKRPFTLRPASGSLVLSGHRYEHVTPYPWTPLMRSTIGGTVFTVEDDIHGSVPFTPDCAPHLATYFNTGTPGATGCQGVQPAAADAAAKAAADVRLASLRYPGRR